MSESAPAYGAHVLRPATLGRMRGATRHACARAVELINGDIPYADALKEAGISRRTLERYVQAMGKAAPEVVKPLDGGRHVPAPLPLFQNDPNLVARMDDLQQRLAALELAWEDHKKARRAMAGYLVDAANELADWPPK